MTRTFEYPNPGKPGTPGSPTYRYRPSGEIVATGHNPISEGLNTVSIALRLVEYTVPPIRNRLVEAAKGGCD